MKKFSVCIVMVIYSMIAVGGAQLVYAQETKAGQGALVGGLLGAVAGGVIGKQSHKTTQGALIGGAVGALGGAAVGSQMKNEPAAGTQTEPVASSAPAASTSMDKVTMKQIIYWTEQGLPSDEIISRIEKSRSTFMLTADDVAYLQKQGVSQRVIEEMQGK